MAGPNTDYTEIAVTTIERRTRKLRDNVSENCALLYRMKERGRMVPADGGSTILEEMQYDENSTAMFYSGWQRLDTSPQNVITTANFPWRQFNVNVSMNGLEQHQNMGQPRQINLLAGRIDNAMKTATNKICEGLHSDGTGDNGNQIDGLQAAVKLHGTTNVGTYGGINSANEDWWRNQAQDAPWSYEKMRLLWLQTIRNSDMVDLIVADNNFYEDYWAALQANERFTSHDTAVGGWKGLKFVSADVIPDGGLGGHAPGNSMYFLNTDYLHYRPHPQRNIRQGARKMSVDQDGWVVPIYWMGNLTCSNRSLQGRIG